MLILADGVIGTMMEPVELPEMMSDEEIAAIRESKKKWSRPVMIHFREFLKQVMVLTWLQIKLHNAEPILCTHFTKLLQHD